VHFLEFCVHIFQVCGWCIRSDGNFKVVQDSAGKPLVFISELEFYENEEKYVYGYMHYVGKTNN